MAPGTPNTGVSNTIATPRPTTYWPQATIWPYANCGPAIPQMRLIGGMKTPRKRAEKTMLMRNPGS